MMDGDSSGEWACPLPTGQYERVVMAHGGGGRLMQALLERLIQPAFANPFLAQRHDSAVIPAGDVRLAFTTDAYVVKPLFFPGGDIGRLSVCGTLNDLAMSGAKPLCLSASLILEEGLPMEQLRRVVESMARTAASAGVAIVTGDTKVVEHGEADGLYINTAGIGLIEHPWSIAPSAVRAGDAILLSGDLGRHGVAILSAREGLEFESAIESDCADLSPLVQALLTGGVELHCLRDLTRGGLASALNEIAMLCGQTMTIEEAAVPVSDAVRGACELLGFDPLYVANEGRLAAFVPRHQADRALAIMQGHPLGEGAANIGAVSDDRAGWVVLNTPIGASRVLDLLSGEQMPRIC